MGAQPGLPTPPRLVLVVSRPPQTEPGAVTEIVSDQENRRRDELRTSPLDGRIVSGEISS